MQLVDYKVRVVNARAGTAARVRVVIESRDGDAVWGTVGVSENIIEASWLALVDSYRVQTVQGSKTRINHRVTEIAAKNTKCFLCALVTL